MIDDSGAVEVEGVGMDGVNGEGRLTVGNSLCAQERASARTRNAIDTAFMDRAITRMVDDTRSMFFTDSLV